MKKKIILLLLVVALLPVRVFAVSRDYKETDDQAIVYMFRGQGCGFCRAFLTFLDSISDEYGKYFKLVSFEVWNNAVNGELMDKISTSMGEKASGVPYIIIGDKVFGGYAEQYDEDIKAAIMAQYENPSYDVMEKNKIKVSDYETMNFIDTLDAESLLKYTDPSTSGSGTSTFAVVFWNFVLLAAATGTIWYFSNKNTQKILDAMNHKK